MPFVEISWFEGRSDEQKAEIADAGRDEGFFRGGRGGGFVEPEADEQIGG